MRIRVLKMLVLQKILCTYLMDDPLLNLKLTRVQTEQISDKFFWGDKLISQCFESNFYYVFLNLFNVEIPLIKI